jgi:hypothetical protein
VSLWAIGFGVQVRVEVWWSVGGFEGFEGFEVWGGRVRGLGGRAMSRSG